MAAHRRHVEDQRGSDRAAHRGRHARMHILRARMHVLRANVRGSRRRTLVEEVKTSTATNTCTMVREQNR
jgi:hypothetical protein